MPQHDFDPYAMLDALRAGEDIDLVRQSVEFVLQALIEAEATEVIGASRHEIRRIDSVKTRRAATQSSTCQKAD
ncbi:MAG TPA: hypothetical protein VMU99_03125 [Acidimicrobiales bacterium]|nr:hypothetical protein [Acidimicrobiales bacterium]